MKYPLKLQILYILIIFPFCLIVADCIFTKLLPLDSIKSIDNMPWIKEQMGTGQYKIDAEIGLIPKNTNPKYLNKKENKFEFTQKVDMNSKDKNILFIGDSVTGMGILPLAIADCLNNESTNFWNAGVGSHNIDQIVKYYEIYLSSFPSQVVIYTFHLNDWSTTPIILKNENEELTGYRSIYGEFAVNEFLYRNSNLYHMILNNFLDHNLIIPETEERVRKKIFNLKSLTKNKKLIILINSTLLPLDQWYKNSHRIKELTIKILEDYNVKYIDLSRYIPEAIKNNINIQELDPWHPGKDISSFMAKKACEEKVIKDLKEYLKNETKG